MLFAGGWSARTWAALAATTAALAVAGCGLGASSTETREVGLLVTADYGHRPVGGPQQTITVTGAETAAQFLKRHGIDTSKGGSLFINGLRSKDPLSETKLYRGDSLWWDGHAAAVSRRVTAVVGAFPEPFLHGRGGKRIPVRLECAIDAKTACNVAQNALQKAGTGIVGRASLGTVQDEETMTIQVGYWHDIRSDFAIAQLERGPGTSGVYVKVARNGGSIALLDASGQTVRTARAHTGLIAATQFQDNQPTWLVTGTDATGLRDAAAALTPDALDGAFAIVLSDDVPTAVPVAG